MAIGAWIWLSATSASTLTAQGSRARDQRVMPPTDSLVRVALAKATAGDTAAALELLERATDQSPRDVNALYWRGLVLSRTTAISLVDTPRRLLARHLLDRANDLDPRNPRYLIELGRIRLKTPLLRVEAERLFRRALGIALANGDPAQLADVAYELGSIKARRYLSGRDRWLYTTTNVIFDPIAARARLHYTREFLQNLSQPIENSGQLDRKEAEEYFRRALAAVPTHAPSILALMGLLYDEHRYDEMRQLALPLIARTSVSAAAAPTVDAQANVPAADTDVGRLRGRPHPDGERPRSLPTGRAGAGRHALCAGARAFLRR
jgi:tetratricopeptide (TPR) repeat protein